MIRRTPHCRIQQHHRDRSPRSLRLGEHPHRDHASGRSLQSVSRCPVLNRTGLRSRRAPASSWLPCEVTFLDQVDSIRRAMSRTGPTAGRPAAAADRRTAGHLFLPAVCRRRRVGRHPPRSDRGGHAREPPARGAADHRVQAEARTQAARQLDPGSLRVSLIALGWRIAEVRLDCARWARGAIIDFGWTGPTRSDYGSPRIRWARPRSNIYFASTTAVGLNSDAHHTQQLEAS